MLTSHEIETAATRAFAQEGLDDLEACNFEDFTGAGLHTLFDGIRSRSFWNKWNHVPSNCRTGIPPPVAVVSSPHRSGRPISEILREARPPDTLESAFLGLVREPGS